MGQAEITAIVYTTFHAVRVFEEMRQRLPDKKSHKTDVSWLFDTWRRGWDSNPCAIARKLISSQPRYDHFDTSPCIFNVNRAFRKMQEKHARTILNCEIWTPEKPYITGIFGGWIDQSGFPFRVRPVMTTSIRLHVALMLIEHVEKCKKNTNERY